MNNAFLVSCAMLLGCASAQPARLLSTADDFKTLGQTNTIGPWEDGLRTDGSPGTYEWWYFDSHLSDGSTLVIVFYTKPLTENDGPLAPAVQVDLTRPDGTQLHTSLAYTAGEFSSSTQQCDVRIGINRFEGDLKTYHLTVKLPEVEVALTLEGEVAAWRPKTGRITFGARDEKYFAWLPSVPQGRVEGTLTHQGRTESISGTGYHDHNWGNASIVELMHHWYWGRARLGDYSVIASFITADEKYGNTTFPIFMLAKGDQVLADDASKVTFSKADLHLDELTQKPVASRLVYDFVDGPKHYRVTFTRHKDIVRSKFIDGLTGLKRFVAGLIGFDAAYLRFTGEVKLEVLEGEAVVESAQNAEAVWELMYLGHARE